MTIALGLAVAGAGKAHAKLFDPDTFTLDNGMQVVVVENHRAPVVTHWVWYKVGTADSPRGKTGLPHFLEHLMFKGTEEIAPGEFSKIIARNGGNDNAMTSYDFTAYFQTIARDRLPLVMEMEADRMANLRLADEHVYPERDVVLEERRSRVDNDPAALLSEQMTAAQFLHHPYGQPVIGWYHEIAGYTREDALSFYDRWYAPNNAVLIVAGDITADELRPIAERTYGKLPSAEVPERTRVQEPPQRAERRLELRHERVQQPSFMRTYLAPNMSGGDKELAYALDVLAEILGGGSTSRLYRSITVEQGIAASIGAYYRGTSLDPATFGVYASPRPGRTLDELEAAIDAEIASVLSDGISKSELERVKQRMLAEAVYARDSLVGSVRIFGVALTTGLTIDEVEAWPLRIEAVSVEDIERAAALVLDRRRAVSGRLLPAEPAGDDQAEAAPAVDAAREPETAG